MTKLSRIRLDPNDMGHYINNLWSVFTLMFDKQDVRALFKDLFTHTEWKMLAKRLEIARRLLEGQKYETIRSDLKVAEHTISSISNSIERDGSGFRRANEILTELEKDFQRKREQRQARIERRVRRKLPAETFLPNLIGEGFNQLDKALNRRTAKSSAKKQLPA
ncbi:MAG: hypothetical protein HYV13_01255 [Candidatus Doudnabacteria bacterium]|nr:hypothetical protein [Candidatus Doudnabacteria bacterium]